jgi:hypothetical protein
MPETARNQAYPFTAPEFFGFWLAALGGLGGFIWIWVEARYLSDPLDSCLRDRRTGKRADD